jgi:1,2-dihydroxy-3-keto-5-methylthiopentene dioxygenase
MITRLYIFSPSSSFQLLSVIEDLGEISTYLQHKGIEYQRWPVKPELPLTAKDEEVLFHYKEYWEPYGRLKGYTTHDVVNVHHDHPQLQIIREKFYQEHKHSEDEVRFFVDGQGLFWFHLGEEVLAMLCTPGDLLSVPAGFPHWFELPPCPRIKVIRLFTDPQGWQAMYTSPDRAVSFIQKFNWN